MARQTPPSLPHLGAAVQVGLITRCELSSKDPLLKSRLWKKPAHSPSPIMQVLCCVSANFIHPLSSFLVSHYPYLHPGRENKIKQNPP